MRVGVTVVLDRKKSSQYKLEFHFQRYGWKNKKKGRAHSLKLPSELRRERVAVLNEARERVKSAQGLAPTSEEGEEGAEDGVVRQDERRVDEPQTTLNFWLNIKESHLYLSYPIPSQEPHQEGKNSRSKHLRRAYLRVRASPTAEHHRTAAVADGRRRGTEP